MDLDALSLKELKDLQSQVAKAIATFEERRKSAALAEVEETARRHGFSLSALTAMGTAKPRRAAAPKYANPANRNETWTGRGRKPRWVEAALKSGKSLPDLAI